MNVGAQTSGVLLPSGEGGPQAPDEGSPPHDSSIFENVERASLTRRYAPPSPGGRGQVRLSNVAGSSVRLESLTIRRIQLGHIWSTTARLSELAQYCLEYWQHECHLTHSDGK